MLRATLKIASICLLLLAGAGGIYLYSDFFSASRTIDQLEQRNQRLEEQKTRLQQVVRTLGEEKRVAEVLVTDQHPLAGGELRTTLLFVEYAKDGTALPARTFTIEGKTAHIDALVIKFDGKFVENRDPLRGHSIALFYRLFGENQNPATAYRIDEPGRVPEIYRGRDLDPQARAFEQELWSNFWKLVEDESYRQAMGVRVAQGESPWGPFEKNRLYTITIESDGGLNITSEPLKGIYQEALKRQPGAS
jgi:hypothetical protein